MKNLFPYLMFNGNAEEAMNFYKDCFNGKILGIERYQNSPVDVPEEFKQKVMHMTLELQNGTIMASDSYDKVEATSTKIQFCVNFENLAEMKDAYDKMLIKGKQTMRIEPQFWGDYMGAIRDNFGINWMFICPQ